MKAVLIAIALVVGSFSAGASTLYKVEKISPAYVNAYSNGYEKPMKPFDQMMASRAASIKGTKAYDGLSCGSDKFVAAGKTGNPRCQFEESAGGYVCETPYVIVCEKK